MEKNVKLLELLEGLNPAEMRDFLGEFYRDSIETDETFGKCSKVSSIGGGEGGGEYVEHIIYFHDHDTYIKFEGFYSSYEGIDWSDCDITQVKPILKTFKVFTEDLNEDETDLTVKGNYYGTK